MTNRLPVFDMAAIDMTPDIDPIGYATTERGAMRILNKYFDPEDRPKGVEVAERWDREGWYPLAAE